MLHNRYASNKEKRTKFVFEMMKNAMKPYEISEKYEEETIGEFENEVEENFFKQFLNLINKPKIKEIKIFDPGPAKATFKEPHF